MGTIALIIFVLACSNSLGYLLKKSPFLLLVSLKKLKSTFRHHEKRIPLDHKSFIHRISLILITSPHPL